MEIEIKMVRKEKDQGMMLSWEKRKRRKRNTNIKMTETVIRNVLKILSNPKRMIKK